MHAPQFSGANDISCYNLFGCFSGIFIARVSLNFLFYIGEYLINNVVLVSTVQWTDSLIHINMYLQYSFSNSFPI